MWKKSLSVTSCFFNQSVNTGTRTFISAFTCFFCKKQDDVLGDIVRIRLQGGCQIIMQPMLIKLFSNNSLVSC